MTTTQTANTILEQLGGGRFLAMTGARNLVGSGEMLMFSVPSNQSRANKVRITLDAATDLYTFEALRVRGHRFDVVESIEGLYAEDLQATFTRVTGFDTTLGTIGGRA